MDLSKFMPRYDMAPGRGGRNAPTPPPNSPLPPLSAVTRATTPTMSAPPTTWRPAARSASRSRPNSPYLPFSGYRGGPAPMAMDRSSSSKQSSTPDFHLGLAPAAAAVSNFSVFTSASGLGLKPVPEVPRVTPDYSTPTLDNAVPSSEITPVSLRQAFRTASASHYSTPVNRRSLVSEVNTTPESQILFETIPEPTLPMPKPRGTTSLHPIYSYKDTRDASASFAAPAAPARDQPRPHKATPTLSTSQKRASSAITRGVPELVQMFEPLNLDGDAFNFTKPPTVRSPPSSATMGTAPMEPSSTLPELSVTNSVYSYNDDPRPDTSLRVRNVTPDRAESHNDGDWDTSSYVSSESLYLDGSPFGEDAVDGLYTSTPPRAFARMAPQPSRLRATASSGQFTKTNGSYQGNFYEPTAAHDSGNQHLPSLHTSPFSVTLDAQNHDREPLKDFNSHLESHESWHKRWMSTHEDDHAYFASTPVNKPNNPMPNISSDFRGNVSKSTYMTHFSPDTPSKKPKSRPALVGRASMPALNRTPMVQDAVGAGIYERGMSSSACAWRTATPAIEDMIEAAIEKRELQSRVKLACKFCGASWKLLTQNPFCCGDAPGRRACLQCWNATLSKNLNTRDSDDWMRCQICNSKLRSHDRKRLATRKTLVKYHLKIAHRKLGNLRNKIFLPNLEGTDVQGNNVQYEQSTLSSMPFDRHNTTGGTRSRGGLSACDRRHRGKWESNNGAARLLRARSSRASWSI